MLYRGKNGVKVREDLNCGKDVDNSYLRSKRKKRNLVNQERFESMGFQFSKMV
jgi:hypothetical protein